MLNHKITASVVMLGMAILLSPAAYAAKPGKIKPDKIDVCHVPESTPDNLHIINISTNGNALNAHLSHGDWEATAELCDAIPDNDCDGEPDPVADDADCVAINGGPGWTCQIGICNSPPTDIALDSADIDENLASGTPVGMLSSTDPDSPGPFTYTFVSGDGDSDNASFSISGSHLLSSATFDFESKHSYSIRLMTDAGDGGTYQEAITISVNDINEAPTAIVLENDSIHENQATGSLISYFTTTDVDAGDSHVYTLVGGPGDTDNASFDIVDDQLVSAESFDFETRDSYSMRVQSEDSGGLTITQSYSITIIDVNDPPTAITLNNSDVDEEQAVGTVVGTFTSTDVDSSIFSYSLVAGFGNADNASFSIVDDQLQSAIIFDYDVQNSFNIRVQTDDGDGGTFQDTFTITINSIYGDDYFPNGVAAGDVDQSSVVLWARGASPGTITFEYGRDPDFSDPPDGVQHKEVVDPKLPVKADISGLLAGTQYYYRACRGGTCQLSMLPGFEARGSFRTPFAFKDGKKGLRFGASSCWRGDLRPFVSIRNVPDRDLDFFVALGDTVYADSPATWDGTDDDDPSGNRAINLQEFRHKNALNYEGPPEENYFALARASTASFVTIDDHEIINNFAGGAHPTSQVDTAECSKEQLGIGPFNVCFCDKTKDPPDANCIKQFINETDLYEDGLQAWSEYNPVREEHYGVTRDFRTEYKRKLYRYQTFGQDAALFMLDARSFRDEAKGGAAAYDADRTMLGAAQLSELLEDLSAADQLGVTWKLVFLPEPIQRMGIIESSDRFEGYQAERSKILSHIENNCIDNVVFISGDIHGTLVNNLDYKDPLPDIDRYSRTWDISTGPAAYHHPLGMTLQKLPGQKEEYDHLDRDAQNEKVKETLNAQLFAIGAPLLGLGQELTYPTHKDKYNQDIPAEKISGRWDLTNIFGWTEFEIDAETQILIVTTYGIPFYDPVEGYGLDFDDYKSAEPEVRGKFTVRPHVRKEEGQFCGKDVDCDSCNCALLSEGGILQCVA
ncbi:MAG: alkaline phosphatase D family protein, partial [Gammaproteobacteria bacterium]|nr:alkaline phosphatase D family protein [Gammaproteobacteria bacterium]